jgi:bifunctional DNA-binding transcriptional regulator/antitoxin component of YhaV-PrlF toxin-antitoxin module
VYAITGVDGRGRVPDLTVVRALGWTAASSLEARACGGLIVVAASAEGSLGLTAHGHVRLPAPLRRACGIEEGNRVLLAAEPTVGVLVVHPLASLDAIVSDSHSLDSTGRGNTSSLQRE